jgi:hypothetical protein
VPVATEFYDDEDLYGSDISDEEISFEGLDISDGEF